MPGKSRAILLLIVCEVAALSVWFSASAVLPSLRAAYPAITDTQAALFTSAVQAGFVLGTLVSAGLGLADRLDPRRFFAAAAAIAALANAALLILPPASPAVFLCRFLTGACMAGVYPVGMKIAASWSDGDLGLIVGAVVGALVLGSGSPHLFNALGGVDWRATIAGASAAAGAAAILVNFVYTGPNWAPAPPFRWALALTAFREPGLRLANFGYFGHMWELYAMWAWIGVFLDASYRASGIDDAAFWGRMAAFLVMGLGGALGSLAGGWIADRIGRTLFTSLAMLVSGSMALTVGWLFGAAPLLLFAVCLVWGISVVADSAQFSSSVAELAPLGLTGTMLTMQTCGGFLLTLITIHLMPPLVDYGGWPGAFSVLALGPLFGTWAMLRLRARPESLKLAGGRR